MTGGLKTPETCGLGLGGSQTHAEQRAVLTCQTTPSVKSLRPRAVDYLSKNDAYPFLMR